MELTQDEDLEKYGKQCGHCNQNNLQPYEYDYSCVVCGYNVFKRKHEFSKKRKKKQILSIDKEMLNKNVLLFV